MVEDRVVLVSTYLFSVVLVVVLEVVFIVLSLSLPEVLVLDSELVSLLVTVYSLLLFTEIQQLFLFHQ